MFVFDTDILSLSLRRAPPPRLLARLAVTLPEEQFTTAITVGELVYGAHRSPQRDRLLRQFEERLWPNLQVLAFDQAAAETYGELRATLEGMGLPLAEPDLRIAAIARTHEMTLITGNTRHFERVPGLRVENWLS